MRVDHRDIKVWDEFSRDLKIQKKIEEEELFELIMNSVCDNNGIQLTNEDSERVNLKDREEEMFRKCMKDLEVKPLTERRK